MNRSLTLILLLPLLFCLPVFSVGQIEGIKYDDVIYDDNIHAVKFHLLGLSLTQPIVELGGDSTFSLSFDDLEEEIRDIYYTIFHCDANWQPSDLNVLEYLDGFDEDQITESDFSFNTLTEYTNYQLQLPNDRMNWTKSGNYVLVVYEKDEDKIPLFSRRFMVVDPMVKILPQKVRPTNLQKGKTHHEIDFNVTLYNVNIDDPRKEFRAVVLQNGRWDNAITDIAPYSVLRDQLIFDYQNVISFPAGKEYRYIDLRSFEYRSEGIATIEEYRDLYEITLFPDPDRSVQPYQYIKDINGNFVLGSATEGDYGLILFSLESAQPLFNADVYLFGKMTDWQIKEKFKLAYSEKLELYAVDVLLKQGYYNYSYVVIPKDSDEKDFSQFEGDWFETENEYTIFTYYRPFGTRYDQLIGTISFKSNQ